MALRKLLGTLGAIVLATGLAAGCGKADTAPKEAQSPTAEEESVDAGAEAAEADGKDAAAEAEGSALQRQKQKAAGRNQMPRKQKPLPLKWKFFRKQFLWIRTASR